MKTCAVVVAAYRAEQWIDECLRSIESQLRLGGWRTEIRVGVDGCESTSRALLSRGTGHYFSPSNVGAYVIRNSLIQTSRADAYAIFDADDIMDPDYLQVLLPLAGSRGIAGSARRTITRDGLPMFGLGPFRRGVVVIGCEAWVKLGGYRSWRIVGDQDLIARARRLKIPVTECARPLFTRRKHGGNLTEAPETGRTSSLRAQLREEMRLRVRNGDLYVEPKTVTMEWRG